MNNHELNSNISVLVVDDNRDMADVTVMLLKSLGFQARGCYGGQQAVDIAQSENFDLIFLDLDMPEMNGFETCERIRGFEWGAELPIVAFSAHNSSEFERHSNRCYFNQFLAKPADLSELQTAIHKSISKP